MKRIHFIAIGGSIMHSLAIALHNAGYIVSGSDDHIHSPARERLESLNLCPEKEGWDENRIHEGLDGVILGMHAFEDNPELLKAKALGLKIYSFPEFIYEHAKDKQRIVVAGSYGKTTITSMIMHVLQKAGKKFDYMVGSQVPGFDNPVRLSEDAPIIVLEGDEYLASRIDPRPKFLLYHPHIVLLSGISWDHINVFPTEVSYNLQFGKLLDSLPKAGYLIYNETDKTVKEMVLPLKDSESLYLHPYSMPTYKIKDGKYILTLGNTTIGGLTSIGGEKETMEIVGKHNMLNISGTWKVCEQLGIELKDFLKHIASFTGAKSRLEKIVNKPKRIVYKDFAHAPAKVRATVDAIKELYPKNPLIACFELHTFSSLDKEFIKLYANSLKAADKKIVFVHPSTLEAKRLKPFTKEEIQQAFGDKNILYIQDKVELSTLLRHLNTGNDVFLMMSSGNFGGLNLENVGL